MDISAHRLSLLLAVHRTGGVVSAAQSRQLSPSAVSQQIKLLEKEVGAQVIERMPQGSVLTEAGRVLVEAAERIEEELATACRELSEIDASTPTGRVRIAAFSTAIRALVLPMLARTAQSHTGLDTTVEEVEERQGMESLRRGELDLLLIERDAQDSPPAPRGLDDVPLLDESWLVIGPADQPAPSTLDDLARAIWIDLDPETAGALALQRLSRQLGSPLSMRHLACDYDVVLAMVDQGLGHALLPELAVLSGHVPQGVSVTRLPGLGTRQIVMRHRDTRNDPTPATRAVLDLLREQAAGLDLG